MAKKFELKDEQLRDSFSVDFPNVDFSFLNKESEAIFNNKNDRNRYEHSKTKMNEAQAAVRVLVDRVNSMSENNLVALAFCREMTRTHRTLQQSLVGQLLVGIHAYAKWAKESELYDDRNRGFIQMAEDLEKLIDEHGLPFI